MPKMIYLGILFVLTLLVVAFAGMNPGKTGQGQ